MTPFEAWQANGKPTMSSYCRKCRASVGNETFKLLSHLTTEYCKILTTLGCW